jgi:putative ABC transport system permease protein
MKRSKRMLNDLDQDIRDHIERETQDNIDRGMSPEEARYAALRKFGNVTQVKEETREVWTFNWLEELWQNIRYGLRMLRKNPGFTSVALITLALGIGANTAIFSVVDSVLLKPLPYPDPDRIVTLSSAWRGSNEHGPVSAPDFHDWHDQSTAFSAIAYYKAEDTAATVGTGAEYVHAARVTAEFFSVFEVGPTLGRLFTADEEKPGSGGAAIVSYTFWRSHFGGKDSALGETVRMYGRSLRIVGVLPHRFRFPANTEIWFPANTILPEVKSRGGLNYWAVARLKPNVSLEQAQAQMTSIASRLEQQYHTNQGMTVAVTRMRDDMVSSFRLMLYLLLGAVALVLLIACANIATLLLARATGRTREIAVRVAIGAAQTRIIRQLLTESFLLALIGGAAGLIVAALGSRALVAFGPPDVPRLSDTGVDGWVLVFTLGISVAASLLFGLAPAVQVLRVDLIECLKQGEARAVGSGRAGRLRSTLVVAEIALSAVLLAEAGLLIKSFVALNNVALGFRPEHVLVMDASVPASDLNSARRATQLYSQLLAGISALPSVKSAGATTTVPGHVNAAAAYWIGHPPQEGENAPTAVASLVAPNTFAALAIPLKSGRDFNEGDTYDAPFSAIVNEALARAAYPGRDPLGRTIFCGLDSPKPMRIVGVVGDVRQYGPGREPAPEIYMPYQQHPGNAAGLSVLVRTTLVPDALKDTLRRMVREQAANVPVRFTTMEASLSEDVSAPRFRTMLLGVFAALAMCLAVAGIYGVMVYSVSQRSNEFGLRMALGATRENVLRLALRQALILVSVGIALGLAIATVVSRLITTMLFDVKPTDLQTYSEVVAVLGVVALVASYVPARRATKVDPMVALRHE